MNKRAIRLISLVLIVMMVMPLVLMACGSKKDSTESKSETTTLDGTDTTTTEVEDTSSGVTTTTSDESNTEEETNPPVNQKYTEWEKWDVTAKQVGAGTSIISKISQTYINDEVKYYIADTYSSDTSKFTLTETSALSSTTRFYAVWDIKLGDVPSDPSEKRTVSVYVSQIEFDFATEFEQYTTQRGKDFIVNFKSLTPNTVYAQITKDKNAKLNIADNTPFVATQLTGNTGEVQGKLKIKYTDLEPGTYYVNYYVRGLGTTLTLVDSVPLKVTENKKYTPSPFKVYVLNIDGYSSISTIDRAEARFYQFFPSIYYAYTELPDTNKGRFKTVYVRITKGTSNDPKTGGADAIAYVSSPADTFYWDATWAARIDDVDCMVHEITHVLQNSFIDVPGFFTEGIAEYSRYVYGGDRNSTWSPPNDKTNEFEAYNAGGFFVYICKTYNSYLSEKTKGKKTDIMVEIFRAAKTGTWRNTSGKVLPSSWVELTGKEYNELVAEYRASDFTMPTDYSNPNGQYAQFVKDLRVTIPEGYVFK